MWYKRHRKPGFNRDGKAEVFLHSEPIIGHMLPVLVMYSEKRGPGGHTVSRVF